MPSLSQSGKPFVHLLDEPAREKAHAARYTKKSDAIDEYGTVVDAMFRIVTGQTLSSVDQAVLKNAMRSKHKLVWVEAGRRLMQLSHYFPAASEALLDLFGDPSAKIRVRVVQSIWTDRPPPELMKSILARGMQDVSAEVRQFSADRAEAYLK